jgi:diguanylate cyclase (GGDEF)-like protein/PAS domain S-box-containing protein
LSDRHIPPGPAGQRRLLTRSLGWLHAIGGSLSVLWLVMPHAARAQEATIVGATLGAYAIAAILFLVGARLSLGSVQALMLGTTTVISVAAAASGEHGSVYALFYLWATLYAFAFFSRRQAMLQVAAVAGAYAVVLHVQLVHTAWNDDVTRWTLTVGTLLAAGWLVRLLTRQLREREQQLRLGIEQSALASAVMAFDGTLLDVNDAGARLIGAPRDQLIGANVDRFRHPDDPELRVAMARGGSAGGEGAYRHEVRVVQPSGEVRWVALTGSVVRDERGRPLHAFAQFDDITARRLQVARQEALSRLAHLALVCTDTDELAGHATGVVAGGLDGTRVALTLSPGEATEPSIAATEGWSERAGRAALAAGLLDIPAKTVIEHALRFEGIRDCSSVRVAIETPAGPVGALCAHGERDFDRDDALFVEAVAGIVGATEARSRAESIMRHQALHDPLTDLPNRALLHDRLAHALARAARGKACVGVLFIDLDHFKVINDSLGHDVGDELLMQVAARLTALLRASDTLGRLGGDEFMVIAEPGSDPAQHVRMAERLGAVLEAPFFVRGDELAISASIGIACGDGDADPRELVRDADAAMYRAKSLGRARSELFDVALRERVLRRLTTEKALRAALAAQDFELAFQPIVTLDGNAIVAAEALLRLTGPEGTNISIPEVISIAEETGLIVPIGAWVLSEACRRAVSWQRIAGRRIDVSVNLSPRQLTHPELIDQVERALADSGLPAEALILEITESVLLGDAERPLEALRALRGLGIRLALDDFGTGYSSLAYLTRLPLDILKLDRAFIARLAPGSQETAVTAAIAHMAEAIGLTVIAEGVETDEQADALRGIGIDLAQGYLYARPMTPAAFESHPHFGKGAGVPHGHPLVGV